MCSGGSGGIRVPIANQQFLGPFPVWQLEADVIQNEAVQQPQPCCFDPPRLGRGTQLSSKPSFLSLSLSLLGNNAGVHQDQAARRQPFFLLVLFSPSFSLFGLRLAT